MKSENDLALLVPEQLNYIWEQEYIVNETLETAIDQVRDIYKKKEYEHYFNYLYLIFLDNLFVIDTKEWKFERKIISQTNLEEIYLRLNK